MKIEHNELENDIALLKLTGQLDMAGFNEEDVRSVLELTGIPAIIPMYDNLESAQAVLQAK